MENNVKTTNDLHESLTGRTSVEQLTQKLTRQDKNQLLYDRVVTNLENKTPAEILKWCIHEFSMIATLAESNADIDVAMAKFAQLKEPNDPTIELFRLFQNRENGCCGNQAINRTAAKYVQILMKIIDAMPGSLDDKQLDPSNRHQIGTILRHINSWRHLTAYNYVKHVNVAFDPQTNELTINLGRQNGTMGNLAQAIVQLRNEPIPEATDLQNNNIIEKNIIENKSIDNNIS